MRVGFASLRQSRDRQEVAGAGKRLVEAHRGFERGRCGRGVLVEQMEFAGIELHARVVGEQDRRA